MASFQGRRAPNVSQYLANLNTIPNQQDISSQNDLDLGNDGLDLLTNVDFFDFDAGNFNADFNIAPQAPQQPVQQGKQNGMQMNGPGYQFSEFQTYPQSIATSPNTLPPSPPNGLQGTYPPQQAPHPHQIQQSLQQQFVNSPQTGDKRKASFAQPPPPTPSQDLEESSRAAAEEDKRRRNTAASARFRVKKKQREQALEKNAKELNDKVSALEGKVQQLEMENKWLKSLITEKGDKVPEKDVDERSTSDRKDGVGTKEKKVEA